MTRDNSKNRRYTKEEKEKLIARMLPPESIFPSKLSLETGISKSTFATWKTKSSVSKIKGTTTFIAYGPNQVSTWDITWLNTYTKGIYYKLYMVIDIFSRKIVDWEVWTEENVELACELIERAMLSEKIKIKNKQKPLVLHPDNGAPMKSYTLKAKLEVLGVISSYSRPRVSNDNPFSEAQFKTMKYRPRYPKDGFVSIEEARDWVANFVHWYNNEHHHSGIRFMTSSTKHNGETEKIINNRIKVYEAARALNPSRFNKGIRNWTPPKKGASIQPTK